jgi:hypothetical protein
MESLQRILSELEARRNKYDRELERMADYGGADSYLLGAVEEVESLIKLVKEEIRLFRFKE